MTEFRQWTNSKRLYHLDLEAVDGSDFPHSKPTWTLAQFNADGSPGQVGTLETPPDLHMGRITTGPLPGKIVVTDVEAHPQVAGRSPTFRVSQHRNGPTH